MAPLGRFPPLRDIEAPFYSLRFLERRLAQPPRSKVCSAPCDLRYARAGLGAGFKKTTQARETDGMVWGNGFGQSGNFRFCSFQRRKKTQFIFALTREETKKQRGRPNARNGENGIFWARKLRRRP